ncbi:MAG: hypothetical protein JWM74_65, partial [Myxococcaceae bacterium]|nr:hypothetical protein [Myxococcaceae bacterium]
SVATGLKSVGATFDAGWSDVGIAPVNSSGIDGIIATAGRRTDHECGEGECGKAEKATPRIVRHLLRLPIDATFDVAPEFSATLRTGASESEDCLAHAGLAVGSICARE